MDAFTPAQTTELISRIGAKKAHMRIDKMFMNSFMGGPLLGFGCALSLSTLSSPWFVTNAPGLLRTIGAMVFPTGLILCVLTGADLFTSYTLYSPVALLHRRITILDLLKTWVVSFFGNLAGMLFFTIVLVGYGGIFSSGYYETESINYAITKAVTPQWHQIFLRGIICNWLVALAVFLAVSSREIFSKILAIWFPVMCFVGIGTDHVIANMFFMPLAIFNGSANSSPLDVGYYIWHSMIPSALGNVVGGTGFVGIMYWYLFLAGQEVELHFDLGPAQTAIFAQGGAISRQMTSLGDVKTGPYDSRLVDSAGHAKSGLASDLAKEKFERKKSSADTSFEGSA